MWDIDLRYLQKDATIEYTDSPSVVSCFFSCMWVGLMIAFSKIMLAKSMDRNVASMGLMSLVYLFFALPGIYVILRRLSMRYAISNRGLLKRTGVITNSLQL